MFGDYRIFSTMNALNQNFSFPKTLMYYICKHPQKISAELFYKLYFSSKYFYPQFKIIPCFSIIVETPMLILRYKKEIIKISCGANDKLAFKLYLFRFLKAANVINTPNTLSLLFNIVWKWNLTVFAIHSQILTLNEYKILTSTSKITDIFMYHVHIKSPDNSTVPFEELLNYVPATSYIRWFTSDPNIYTTNTSQKMANLNHIGKLYGIYLDKVPRHFNPTSFGNFIKKNARPKALFDLTFNNFDEEFGLNYTAIVNQILDTWQPKEEAPKLRILNNHIPQ